MATIKDVARQAGLSITTVSRALNGYDDVAEATRQRVRAIAQALDYHPNAAARSLQGSRANTIGLGIPPVLHRSYDAFWLEFIGGMATTCARHRYDLLVATAEGHESMHSLQRLVRGRRVDGLVLCDVRVEDPRIAYLQRHHLPFVAFGRTVGEQQTYPFIDVDGLAGVREAVEHLVRLGHRRIGYLGVDRTFGFSHYRFLGYQDALARAQLPADPALIYHDLSEDTVEAAVTALLGRSARPTALFAAADVLGVAALKTARALGLRIPGDLALAVFDDTVLVQHAEPPLTAVSQPNRQLGEEAAALLLERIAHPDQPIVQRLITPTLIMRASTGSDP